MQPHNFLYSPSVNEIVRFMFALLFQAAGFLDVMDTLNDLSFVVKIIVFSYFLYWLFVTFRELPIVFGLSVVGLAYLMFVAAIPMLVIAI